MDSSASAQKNYLQPLDYVALLLTLLIPIVIGFYHGFKSKSTTEEVLVGSRTMSIFPVAASIMMTFFSATSLIGYPAEVYSHGIQIFMIALVASVFKAASAFLFVPVLFPLKLTSAFEYLQLRFSSQFLRQMAATLFILYTTILLAITIYAPSIAIEAILGIPMRMSILVLGIVCTVYTAIGGYKAVIWGDLSQLIILMLGMVVIVARAMTLAGGPLQTFHVASAGGRLNLFEFAFDPFMRHNFWNFLFGTGVKTLITIGTAQNQVQRFSSVPTQRQAIRSLLLSIPFSLVAIFMVSLTGLAIYAALEKCDPIKAGHVQKADQIVPYFVIQNLDDLPGILGVFLSTIVCAVLSTCSSYLNSIAAVLWEDILGKIGFFNALRPKSKAVMTRGFSFVFGFFAVGLALLVPKLGSILTMTLSITGAFSSPIAATFVLGIFVPFANKYGAMAGLLAGMSATATFVVKAYFLKVPAVALATSVEGCQVNKTTTISLISIEKVTLPFNSGVVEWPDKLFTVSYLLYPTVGAIITLVIGVLVSLATSSKCCSLDLPRGHASIRKTELIHPWLRSSLPVDKYKEDPISTDSVQMNKFPSLNDTNK